MTLSWPWLKVVLIQSALETTKKFCNSTIRWPPTWDLTWRALRRMLKPLDMANSLHQWVWKQHKSHQSGILLQLLHLELKPIDGSARGQTIFTSVSFWWTKTAWFELYQMHLTKLIILNVEEIFKAYSLHTLQIIYLISSYFCKNIPIPFLI